MSWISAWGWRLLWSCHSENTTEFRHLIIYTHNLIFMHYISRLMFLTIFRDSNFN